MNDDTPSERVARTVDLAGKHPHGESYQQDLDGFLPEGGISLVYRMLRYGMKYVDQGAKFYEVQHRNLQIKQLKWKAAKLGFQVVEAAAA